jgi:hypothetical protein
MDMTNVNAVVQNDELVDTLQSRIVELQELQLALVGGGIGDTQL